MKKNFKKLKVALYDPYLDTLGGGEKYILSIIAVFAEEGAEVTFFWDKDLSNEIKNRFSFQCFKTLKWKKNIFEGHSLFNTLKTLWTLRTFDYFFYVTNGSYFFSPAKKNFIYAMVPDERLYKLSFLNRLKLANYKVVTHSHFTQKWLGRFGFDSFVLPPIIDIPEKVDLAKKEKIILSVGRFFSHLHSKRQDVAIEAFKKLKKAHLEFSDYRLILAGGLKEEDKPYLEKLKSLAKDDSSIIFKPNIGLYELYRLYRLSTYFWHFTGFGIDDEKNPEAVEHLGLTPLEAASHGCVVMAYNAGGLKETVENGRTGFLFSSVEDLIRTMSEVNSDPKLKGTVTANMRKEIKKMYNYRTLEEKVHKII